MRSRCAPCSSGSHSRRSRPETPARWASPTLRLVEPALPLVEPAETPRGRTSVAREDVFADLILPNRRFPPVVTVAADLSPLLTTTGIAGMMEFFTNVHEMAESFSRTFEKLRHFGRQLRGKRLAMCRSRQARPAGFDRRMCPAAHLDHQMGHTIVNTIAGSARIAPTSARKRDPCSPSTSRWSNDRVSVITLRSAISPRCSHG